MKEKEYEITYQISSYRECWVKATDKKEAIKKFEGDDVFNDGANEVATGKPIIKKIREIEE